MEGEQGHFSAQKKARALTNLEIHDLVRKDRAIRARAVENFLMSLDLTMDLGEHMDNLRMEAAQYHWNRETRDAIKRGLLLAYDEA